MNTSKLTFFNQKYYTMKKILTLLTFVFFTSGLVFGQCPANANGNSSGRFFNLNYSSAAEAGMFFGMICSITVPAAGGGTITVDIADLQNAGAGGSRIRPVGFADGTFGGQAPFTGTIMITLCDGTVATCDYAGNALVLQSLPVELVSFDGTKKDRQINLNWKTASELNNDGFVIEKGDKTAYGMEWNRFGFIEGNGTTQEIQTYSFIDQRPEEGVNYYRLKQMDFDGNYEYSSIIAIDYANETGSGPIAIFPNPAKDQLTLVNAEGMATIYNVLGKPIKQLTIDDSETTIELFDLINGQYYLQVLQEDGTIVTKQFGKMN